MRNYNNEEKLPFFPSTSLNVHMINCLTRYLSNIRKPDNFPKDVEEESVKRRSKLGGYRNSLNYVLETAPCLEFKSINYFRENRNLTSFDYDDN